jgi:hypothetical protein
VAIVVLPAAPIDVATVVDQAVSVAVVGAMVAAVVVLEVAVIAVRLRPVQPVPSVGLSAIAHLVIAHSVIVHQVIVPSRIVHSRIAPRVVVLSVTDLPAIDRLGTEQARRVTVVQVSNLATVRPGQMPAEHSPVQPVRSAPPSHPARTSFAGLGRPSLAQ